MQFEFHIPWYIQFSHSVVLDSATPWTAARQASLSIANSLSFLKLMSIELVMPSNSFILCHLTTLLVLSKFIIFKKNYLFIWLYWVLVGARRIFSLSCNRQDFSCSMWTLSCGICSPSSSLTRDWTWTPCIGSSES